jgi:FlaG/FlaF family flagellin (archaellin)
MADKKGISEVIATVFIIMLTVIAVAVIAAFVVPFVKNSLQKSTECFEYTGYFSLDSSSGLNCWMQNETSYLHGAYIKTLAGKNISEGLEGFVLVFYSLGGEAKTMTVKPGPSSGELWILNKAGQDINIPNSGEAKTYIYNSTAKFDSVEVHPVLKSGRICAEKDSIELVKCKAGIVLQ